MHPLLARLYAARGISAMDELDDGLHRLLPPGEMRGTAEAASLLADAIVADRQLCIVADYDCDGATACAVGLRGLRLLGARHAGYIVPDRVLDGYGLTAPIAQRVKDSGADVLITVDNGIASIEGVARARALGLQVLVTDHHLPASELPQADVIVNPNQPGCSFPSKSIAGVGRDVLCAAGLARRTTPKRDLYRADPAQAGRPAAAGGTGHGGRCGAAGHQQPPPGGPGPQAGCAPVPCRWGWPACSLRPGARPRWPPPSTSVLRSGRASMRPGA
jgi:single-stranded-DNA-specific exonuclease